MSSLAIIIYSIFALTSSIFYGLKAREIFIDSSTKEKPLSWKIHQFWLNFLGSALGWTFFLFVLPKIISLNLIDSNKISSLDKNDILIIIISFIGITGFMPQLIVGIVTAFKEIISKLLGFFK